MEGPVGEVEDDGGLCAEPGAEAGQPRQLIALLRSRVRPSLPTLPSGEGTRRDGGRGEGGRDLEEVLVHVIPEVLEEGDFLVELLGGRGDGVEELLALLLHVLQLLARAVQDESGGVVEEDTHAAIGADVG